MGRGRIVTPFEIVVDNVRERLESGQDDVIGVVGYEGSGKSTLAQWLGLAIDPDFSVGNVCYGMKEFTATTRLPPGSARVTDEALLGSFGRRASSTENTSNVLLISLGRMRSMATIMCAASLQWIDPYFRTHRIRRLFVCHGEGWATYYLRLKNPPDPDFPFAPVFMIKYPMLPESWWNAYQERKAAGLGRIENEIVEVLEKKGKKKGKK